MAIFEKNEARLITYVINNKLIGDVINIFVVNYPKENIISSQLESL